MSFPKPAAGQDRPVPEGRVFTGQELGAIILRACHDLRTPLRAIRGHAELLAKAGAASVTPECDPRLAFIIEGAAKLDHLVDGLSSYSLALRIDPGSFAPTPLGVLLRAVLVRLDAELRQSQVEVKYSDLPHLSCDPDRIMSLFENLILYALRGRGQASLQIHITGVPQAEGWLFAVRDNGPSMGAGDLERIFQPFGCPGRTAAVSGLELAICRETVERHGGRIWAESEAGSGCTFLFTLPGR